MAVFPVSSNFVLLSRFLQKVVKFSRVLEIKCC